MPLLVMKLRPDQIIIFIFFSFVYGTPFGKKGTALPNHLPFISILRPYQIIFHICLVVLNGAPFGKKGTALPNHLPHMSRRVERSPVW